VLIGSRRPRCHGIVAQVWFEVLAFLFGQAGQDAPGFGGSGQNAFHGAPRIGAEADRSFQSG
jgi:hypothetical protein